MIEKIKVWIRNDEELDEHTILCEGCPKRTCPGYTVSVETYHRKLKD